MFMKMKKKSERMRGQKAWVKVVKNYIFPLDTVVHVVLLKVTPCFKFDGFSIC